MGWQQRALVLLVLWLAGLYLRLTVLVAPPLAPLIDAELSLSQAELGALTTLPVLMLSLGALPGSMAIAKIGPKLALAFAIVLVSLTSVARGLAPPVWILFFSTTLMGLAIAVMQPALPALVLRWCPGFAALGSAVYMNGMLMGEFIGGGLTIPLVMPLLDNDWRDILLFWSLPGLIVAILVLGSRYLGIHQTAVADEGPPQWKPPLSEPRVWQFGIILGAAAAGFFGTNAYLPSLLEYKGVLHELPDYLLIFNATQVVGSLLMLALAQRLVGNRRAVIVVAWGVLIGLVGVVLCEGLLAVVAAIALGFATCIQLILMVALVPLVSNGRSAAPLAAGMFMIGYLLGFVVPLAGGLLADVLTSLAMIFAPLILLAALAIAIAHRSDNLSFQQ